MLDSAVKIGQLPVSFYAAGPATWPGFDRLVCQSALGFAYAGSSLLGLNTLNTLGLLLSRINVFTPENSANASESPAGGTDQLPALAELARLAAEVLKRTAEQYAYLGGGLARCEIAIAGCCPATSEPQIYWLTTEFNAGEVNVKTESYGLTTTDEDFVLFLGQAQDTLRGNLAELRSVIRQDTSDKQNSRWGRAPLAVILRETATPSSETIGGFPQLGIGDASGFRLFPLANTSSEHRGIYYLGHRVDLWGDLLGPGYCLGVSGMLIDDQLADSRMI